MTNKLTVFTLLLMLLAFSAQVYSQVPDLVFVGGDLTTRSLAIIAPIKGDELIQGKDFEIKWEHEESYADSVRLILLNGSAVVDTISNGAIDNNGSFTWSVPVDDTYNGTDFYIKVASTNTWEQFTSEAFTIKTLMTMIYPGSGDTLRQNMTYKVTWNKNKSKASSVRLILHKGTEVLDTISNGTISNDGLFEWKLSHLLEVGNGYRIKLVTASSPVESTFTESFVVDSIKIPEEIIDDSEYYKGVKVANQCDVTSGVSISQFTMRDGNIYTVFKRGTGSAVADREVKISITDVVGKVIEIDITAENNVNVSDPFISSTQSSVVAMYQYNDGTKSQLYVARSTDKGKTFDTYTLATINPTSLFSDGVYRYFIMTENSLYYSVDNGKTFCKHQGYSDLPSITHKKLMVTKDDIYMVGSLSSDSIVVYRAHGLNENFEKLCSFYSDLPSSDDFEVSLDGTRCAILYQHEEVGNYYDFLRFVDGTTLGEKIELKSGISSTELNNIYLDKDTLYFVDRSGNVKKYSDGQMGTKSYSLMRDFSSSYHPSDLIFRKNGEFYCYEDFTNVGSKKNLTFWYWKFGGETFTLGSNMNISAKFSIKPILLGNSGILQLKVGIPDLNAQNLNIKIFNPSGRRIKTLNKDINRVGWLNASINLGSVANGFYLIKAQLGKRVLRESFTLKR